MKFMRVPRTAVVTAAFIVAASGMAGAAALLAPTEQPATRPAGQVVQVVPDQVVPQAEVTDEPTTTTAPEPPTTVVAEPVDTSTVQAPATTSEAQQPTEPIPTTTAEVPTTTAEPVPGGPPMIIPTPTPTWPVRCLGPEDRTPGCVR